MRLWRVPTNSRTVERQRIQMLSNNQVPVFTADTTGGAPKSKYIMGKRNWCSVKWDPLTGDLVWDIRVEISKGNGTTTG